MSNVSSQVAAAHLEFIEPISACLASKEPSLAQQDAVAVMIATYREEGWSDLCRATVALLAGQATDEAALDDEDRMILAAIEQAAKEPGWLEGAVTEAEAQAAEQIAALILAATWGEREALAALNEMRAAAQAAGLTGSTAHAFIAMVEGERELDALLGAHKNAQTGLIERTLAALSDQERDPS
ncbi:MAG TPA: hypothetical protein VK979_04865 [Guyparkeria sp.]|nr:hypothetical protein [Guyparkeria sp.]